MGSVFRVRKLFSHEISTPRLDLTISAANRAGPDTPHTDAEWISVGNADDLAPGTVHSVKVGEKTAALVRDGAEVHALDGRCPHQGGPLSEGTVCDGAVRCPWHGWDFSLSDGKGVGNELSVPRLEVRQRGNQLEIAAPRPRHSAWTVSHVMVETMVNWGIDTVFGMVGHSNLGLAEAIRVQADRGKLRYFGVRHEGAAAFACSGYAKTSGKPAACLTIAGPGATNNNGELGKISKEQRDGEWKVWQTGLHNPSFAEYARLCGAAGFRVERADQLRAALEQALALDGPAVVEIISDPLLT